MVTLSIRMLCFGYQGSASRGTGTSTLSFLRFSCSALSSSPVIRVSSSTMSSGIGLSQWLFCSPVLTGMPLLDSVCGRAGSEITGSFGFRAGGGGIRRLSEARQILPCRLLAAYSWPLLAGGLGRFRRRVGAKLLELGFAALRLEALGHALEVRGRSPQMGLALVDPGLLFR